MRQPEPTTASPAPLPLQVLFGLLLRGDRPQAAGAGGSGAGASGGLPADSNILRMAPVGPRLSYLPVTTPVALLRHGSQPHPLHHAGSASTADLARLGAGLGLGLPGSGGGGAAGSEVSAAAYSFANLLSASSKAARQDGATGEAAAASSSVGSGVASKLAGLGDSLVAQLGDMSAAQGLLSSLGARFNK